MKILYDLFFILFSIGYLPYLFIKGKFHKDFFQKFGFIPKDVQKLVSPVWIHAVSVGEANSALKLASEIKEVMPDVPVIVSTTTQTGNEVIRKDTKRVVDEVFYYPIDLSWIVRDVIKKIGPRLYLIVETEIWPNIISEMQAQSVPVVIVNGRISDSSFKNYKMISFIVKKMLASVDMFCMQSEQDADRIKKLGAPSEKVRVTGNLKFDEVFNAPDAEDINEKRIGFDFNDDIIIAGSTHYPEEGLILDIFQRLKEENEKLKLVLAPRHIERTDAIKIYCEKSDIDYICLSDVLKKNMDEVVGHEVLLVDTIGHLKNLYKIATVVFIGGSIAKKGGQNPIEGAIWGKPVIFGPNMNNFRQISGFFLENNAAIQIQDKEDLENKLAVIISDKGLQDKLSCNAKKVISENKGAVNNTFKIIENVIISK